MADILDFTKPHVLRTKKNTIWLSLKSIPFSTQIRSPDQKRMTTGVFVCTGAGL